MIEEAWDAICDGFEYIVTFEFFGDLLEFIGSAFEDIGEISLIGFIFGAIGVLTIYLARDYMLKPFLMHMGSMEAILWGGATYVGTFVAGYLLGKAFENAG